MELNAGRFNRHIAHLGTSFFHRRAFICPCLNPGSNSADPSCPNCLGKGVTWAAETGPHKVGYMAQQAKKGMQQFGSWEPGDAILSLGSDTPVYAAGHYDRFRAVNSRSAFSVPLRRGLTDRLTGTIVSIDRVFWRNPQTKALVDGGIPAVAADGALTWASGAPPAGYVYTVSGIRYDEFFAYLNMTQDRPIHDAALPRKLPVRRFDLFGR